jgi:hypothetical protein
MAAAAAVKEALWLKMLLPELGYSTDTVTIFGVNQGSLKLLKHPLADARAKHIDVIHHFARERVNRGEVDFKYFKTGAMVADILTKALPKSKFELCRCKLGLNS